MLIRTSSTPAASARRQRQAADDEHHEREKRHHLVGARLDEHDRAARAGEPQQQRSASRRAPSKPGVGAPHAIAPRDSTLLAT